MPLIALLLLFIAVPLAELYVIIQVGQEIGAGWTILILVADSILGTVLLRSQGRAAWRRFNDALRAGRVPHREVLDGALVIVGGALLLTPGFLTDIVGLLLLLPPTRAVARRIVAAAAGRRIVVAAFGRAGRGGPPPSDRRAPSYDVEGTATEQPRERPRLER